MSETVVEITAMLRIKTLLERRGVDPHGVVAKSSLDPAWMQRTEGFIPLRDILGLYVAASEALDDPDLGLTIAESFEPSDYGMIGHLFKVQPTFDDALDALDLYYNQFLADDLQLGVHRDGDQTRVTFGFRTTYPGLELFRPELVSIVYLAIHKYGAESIVPLSVKMQQAEPVDRSRYDQAFGVEVQFDAPITELVLPSAPLSTPCPTADPRLARLLIEAAETHLAKRREAAGAARKLLRLEGCVVDLRHGVVQRDGEHATLTTKERELLEYFSQRPNEVVSHDDLEREVWHLGRTVVSHAPAVAIRRLRQKIEPKPGRPVNLVTVFGEGWRLAVPEAPTD